VFCGKYFWVLARPLSAAWQPGGLFRVRGFYERFFKQTILLFQKKVVKNNDIKRLKSINGG
jgi:hypothetical protein